MRLSSDAQTGIGHSIEECYLRTSQKGEEKGDVGAFVLSDALEWMGLLWSGSLGSWTPTYTFSRMDPSTPAVRWTEAADVLEDIKKYAEEHGEKDVSVEPWKDEEGYA